MAIFGELQSTEPLPLVDRDPSSGNATPPTAGGEKCSSPPGASNGASNFSDTDAPLRGDPQKRTFTQLIPVATAAGYAASTSTDDGNRDTLGDSTVFRSFPRAIGAGRSLPPGSHSAAPVRSPPPLSSTAPSLMVVETPGSSAESSNGVAAKPEESPPKRTKTQTGAKTVSKGKRRDSTRAPRKKPRKTERRARRDSDWQALNDSYREIAADRVNFRAIWKQVSDNLPRDVTFSPLQLQQRVKHLEGHISKVWESYSRIHGTSLDATQFPEWASTHWDDDDDKVFPALFGRHIAHLIHNSKSRLVQIKRAAKDGFARGEKTNSDSDFE